ncbi:hypothetical protein FDUTEX481_04547 [Tolypothrix sp. PCC 7601]|nr:hypothetical protein FDUTEX481_04547 [Tolypothrix sp. PCC 7601]
MKMNRVSKHYSTVIMWGKKKLRKKRTIKICQPRVGRVKEAMLP